VSVSSARPGLRARFRIHCRLAVFACLAAGAGAQTNPPTGASTSPFYTSTSIVQAASNAPGPLAPNAIASLYGTNLSYATHTLVPGDLQGGDLPTSLVGVTVYVNGLPADLIYVSPVQINFLIPYVLTGSSVTVQIVRQGVAGPAVQIALAPAAPAFFQWDGNFAVAEHADGSLVTPQSPAQPGEIVVLYAAGLGRTSPDLISGEVAEDPAQLFYLSELQLLLNGVPIPASSIFYAGVTPGFAGLYQINVQLPASLPANPQIQVAILGQTSPAAVQLPAQ
jgi:uncharacterized protein (TIGR03437 family)